ncbi:ATP-binding cassette transporter snq2 [Umbelopsis nana]
MLPVLRDPLAARHSKFWSSWLYWLVPYHYVIEGLVTNVLEGDIVHCNENDFFTLIAPPSQTCAQYLAPYFQNDPGYVDNPNDTTACKVCQYTDGSDYYSQNIGWNFANRWRDFGIVCAYCVFNIATFAFFVWLFRKPRR